MTTKEWLTWLTDKSELGIPLRVIAEHCHCSTTTILRAVKGEPLTERTQFLLDLGVEKFLDMLRKKLGME